ncbi:hypothetical protein RB595_010725 [Gaeumannomyces hyphopodioides]
MARTEATSLQSIDQAQDQVKDVIQGLYQVMAQVMQYDNVGGQSSKEIGGQPSEEAGEQPSEEVGGQSSKEIGKQSSKEIVANELQSLSNTLKQIHTVSTANSTQLPRVPKELIEYVENGRSPDIYTRDFVDVVRRGNQLMRGKLHAYASFRDILAGEMRTALPELRDDVDKVIAATTPNGGRATGV